MKTPADTIAAVATPPGRGGVGIVRISGNAAKAIAEKITHKNLIPREALFSDFVDHENNTIDQGIVLYFQAPHSFTGEDVVELQAHGSPWVLDELLKTIFYFGARMARPGEFSERAFLNNKIDLTQAEAIADLINAQTETAARSASKSLQGAFSKKINALREALIRLQMFVEASIDFPEEEIDFIQESKVQADLKKIIDQLKELFNTAKQGVLLQEGISIVIAGKPNAGKSSLLNALAQKETAIVTDIPGTTRDVLKEKIELDGVPVHVIDTAGLRESDDPVEKIGVARAFSEIENADVLLWIEDATTSRDLKDSAWVRFQTLAKNKPFFIIQNKLDLLKQKSFLNEAEKIIGISIKENAGIDLLKNTLKKEIGFHCDSENIFIARRRHLDALERALVSLHQANDALQKTRAYEFLAEELRVAQKALGEITGAFTADDLLGKIFSEFCIGK